MSTVGVLGSTKSAQRTSITVTGRDTPEDGHNPEIKSRQSGCEKGHKYRALELGLSR